MKIPINDKRQTIETENAKSTDFSILGEVFSREEPRT